MRQVRVLVLVSAVAATLLLALLCVAGAFRGAERAQELFNSVPLLAFWALWAALLGVTIIGSPRLWKAPARLAMHAAPLLILAGGFLNSDRGHAFARRFLGSDKVARGYLVLAEGQAGDTLFEDVHGGHAGVLPFTVALREFFIERYDPTETAGDLLVWYVRRGEKPSQRVVAWRPGEVIDLPEAVRFRVRRYYTHAVGRSIDGRARVEAVDASGARVTLPADAGASATLPGTKTTVRIVELFGNLGVEAREGEKPAYFERPGPGRNPAVVVEVVPPDGPGRRALLLERVPMHGQAPGVHLRLLPGVETLAEMPEGGAAVEVEVTQGEREERHALHPDPLTGMAVLSLPTQEVDSTLAVYLIEPDRPVKRYRSVVEIPGATPVRAAVEVNHPFHYRGYHFYQHSWEPTTPPTSVLRVASDSGLVLVYAGFVLLAAGVTGWCWGGALKRPKPAQPQRSEDALRD